MLTLPASVERVARDLREDILRGRLQTGDRLPSERDLAERTGVNRGAVREGLRALAQLGLVEIGPRGAQVAPISEASLDVLGHLLALDALPDAELADQVLEVHALVFGSCMRMAVERGTDEQIEDARKMVDRVGQQSLSETAYAGAIRDLVHVLVDAAGNFVLRLVRRGLELEFWDRIQALGISPRIDHDLLTEILGEIDRALAERDASSAHEHGLRLIRAHRDRVVVMLHEEHDRQTRSVLEEGLAKTMLRHLTVQDAEETSE